MVFKKINNKNLSNKNLSNKSLNKKNLNKKLKLFLFFIFCLILLPNAVNAEKYSGEEYRVIFNHLDTAADDYGPGYYQYPKHHIFQNKGHLFDLKALTIFESENNYKFRFSFAKLTDPWGAKFAFSLPLIEVYIDNQPGGSNELFQSGANISFKEDFKWNKFLKISGWWVRLFEPESREKNILDINELINLNSNSLEDFELTKRGDEVLLEIPKAKIASLEASKIIILIGSFDPFGFDHFRSLAAEKRYWQIYAPNKTRINKLPRVLDILVPGGEKQQEILSGELPLVPYLKVAEEVKEVKKDLIDKVMPLNFLSLTLVFLYLLLIIFIIYKFQL